MRFKTIILVSILLIISSLISFGLGYFYRFWDPTHFLASYYENRLQNLKKDYENQIKNLSDQLPLTQKPSVSRQPVPKSQNSQTSWSGPEFWQAISNKRVEVGLSPITVNDLLCTFAAIRLAEIRRLGRLDDHEGFNPLVEKYKEDLNKEDLLGLFEFLTSGAPTAKEAVDGLYDTLGHKTLFTEIYKAGCAYAADGFGVVITSK